MNLLIPSFSHSASLVLLALGLLGCTGNILQDGKQVGIDEQDGDTGPATGMVNSAGNVVPGASYLRRLTNAEYNSTVHDLLGETGEVVDRAAQFGFVPDTRVHGFESNATNVSMSAAVLERYRDAAESLAAEVLRDPARSAAVAGCELANGAACVSAFIERFASAAYRRPLLVEEAEELADLAETAAQPALGAELVMQHVLLSPNFLFRIEEGEVDDSRPQLLRLTGYEIATRLSYLMLGTTPGPALLARAGAGELAGADGVAATARSMLTDARARGAVQRFYEQWLRIDRLPALQRDAELYPEFDADLKVAMYEETARLVDTFIWEPGHNFLDLISSQQTFMNPRLADFYGSAAVSDWQLVEYSSELGRAGLLSHASVLAVSAQRDQVTSTLRGKYVREVMLCEELAGLPANVPELPAAQPGQTERERMEQHTSEPSCAGCHQLMDPVGAGLARFDSIGRFRTVDALGAPVSTEGELFGYPELEDPAFDGAVELAQRVRALPQLGHCVATQLFRHAFARVETPEDGPTLAAALRAFEASNFSLQELLLSLVTSDAFRYREPLSAQGAWE